MSEKDAVASSLQDSPPHHGLPQHRYPSSRWQQLKHSIAAKDSVHLDLPANYSGLAAGSTSQARRLSLDQHVLGPDAAPSIQQEAADVLRRLTDADDVSPVRKDRFSSFVIQDNGRITSNSRYQGLLDSSIAEFGSCGNLLPTTNTGQPLADAALHTCGVNAGPPPQLFEHKSPAKQAALQQLKQQRQQARPRQASAGPAQSAAVSPMKHHTRANTTRPVSAPHASIRLRASHQQVKQQPSAAHRAKHLSSSVAGSWANVGGRSSITGLQIGQQVPAPGTKGSPPDLVSRARAVTAEAHKSITAAADQSVRASIVAAAKQLNPLTTDTSSYALDSIKGLDSSLVHELQQELADQMLRRLVRRWQQATVDVQVDKARARPMQKLLSKRKALRAWKLAHQQHLGDQLSDADQEPSQDTLAPASQAEPPHLQHNVSNQQSSPDAVSALPQRDMEQQLEDREQRRDIIAAQFHKLYRLHGCLSSWRHQTAGGALQRLRDENDRVLAEQQARVLQQQQEREQQQLQQQQEQHRLAVAANFHTIYVQHKVLACWHQQAAITASLNKLFPDTGLAAAIAAAPRAGKAAGNSQMFPAGLASDELQAAAVVQQKAQQLLHRLASKQASQQQQQQQQRHQQRMHVSDSVQQPEQTASEVSKPDQQQLHHQGATAELQQQELSAKTAELIAAAAATVEQTVPEPTSKAQQQQEGPAEAVKAPGAVRQHLPCEDAHRDIHAELPAPSKESTSDVVPADAPLAAQSGRNSPGMDGSSQTGSEGLKQQTATTGGVHGIKQERQPELTDHAHQELQPSDAVSRPCESAGEPQQQQVPAQQHAAPPPPPPLQQAQQVPRQQSWEVERQQLQQQLRRMLLVEQRHQRQQQLLEQELQAEITADQAALAELHYDLVLVQRLGLQPWTALRQQQDAAAATWRSVGLLKAGLMVWKLLLMQRHQRRACCQIRAYGLILQVHQQLQKASALAALAAWTQASKQYRHWLQWRVVAAWQDELQSSQQLQAAVKHAREDRRKRQVVHAWAEYMEQQAQDQLLLELELDAAGQSWRCNWLRRKVVMCWHAAASTAVRKRELEARRLETWSKVRGWLSERDSSKAGSMTPAANMNGHGQLTSNVVSQGQGDTLAEPTRQPAHQWRCTEGLRSLCDGDTEAVIGIGLNSSSAAAEKQAASSRRYASQDWAVDSVDGSIEDIDDEFSAYSLSNGP